MMQQFLSWVKKRGMKICDQLEPRYTFDRGWGVYAVTSIRPVEVMVRVPNCLIIRAATVANQPYYVDAIERRTGLLTPFDTLVLFFCFENESTSDYGPYLRILPQRFDTPVGVHPVVDPEVLPRSCRLLLQKQMAEIEVIVDKMMMMAVELGKKLPTRERVLWSWHVVNTRCIYMNSREHRYLDNRNGDCLAIIPFVDMFNHTSDASVMAMYVSSSNTFELQMSRTVEADSEVLLCYGPHGNNRLFLEYGFVEGNNPNNALSLTVDEIIDLCKLAAISITDKHEQILNRAQLGCNLYQTQRQPAWNVLASFRIATLEFNQLGNWQKIVYSTVDFSDPYLDEQMNKVFCLLIEQTKMNRKRAETFDWPDKLKCGIAQLWQDEIDIVEHFIDHYEDEDES